ncbi:MAG: S1/P1 nuclease [Limisphaerales bacterium]
MKPPFSKVAMTKFLMIFCTSLCLQLTVRAWNAEGHMIVAQIAYNHLNPVARAKCNTLIAVNLGSYYSAGTSNFVTAAAWADDFKAPLGTGIWHYIDLPFSLDGTSTSGVAASSFDVVKAINLSITNLQNSSLSQSNQAVSLRYLIHFVGDIQQPLHCSTAVWSSRTGGDAGGNSFYITSDYWNNLHSLWDSGGGYLFDSLSRPLSVASQNILNAKVAAIEADYSYNYNTNLGTIPNPMTWAQEGLNLAKTVSYVGITLNGTPSANYLDNAEATTEQRMAAGGHRLADLLNTLYPAPPIVLSSAKVANGKFSFSWNTITNGAYRVQWKQQLTDATWTDLANIMAMSNSASFSENLNQTRKFYRIIQY